VRPSRSWRTPGSGSRRDTASIPSTSGRHVILTAGELKVLVSRSGNLISTAQEELDRLYKVVREADTRFCSADAAGVAIEHRGEATEASQFEYWGTGSAASGPRRSRHNAWHLPSPEERPVTVHRSQHFPVAAI